MKPQRVCDLRTLMSCNFEFENLPKNSVAHLYLHLCQNLPTPCRPIIVITTKYSHDHTVTQTHHHHHGSQRRIRYSLLRKHSALSARRRAAIGTLRDVISHLINLAHISSTRRHSHHKPDSNISAHGFGRQDGG